jgi:hypothetical protein
MRKSYVHLLLIGFIKALWDIPFSSGLLFLLLAYATTYLPTYILIYASYIQLDST